MPDFNEYNKRKAELDKEYRIGEYSARLKGLQLYLGINEETLLNKRPMKKGELTKMVREVIKSKSGLFDMNDIFSIIKLKYPDFDRTNYAVSSVLVKMKEKNEIDEVIPQKGRTPARYVNIENTFEDTPEARPPSAEEDIPF